MASKSPSLGPEIALAQVVRGELPWRDLTRFGVGVRLTETGVEAIGAVKSPVKVSAEDIAWGWLRSAKNSSTLREWARVVHGATSLIQLDAEKHPLGDAVLEALWAAAYGDPVTSAMTAVMRKVVSSS